MNLLILLAACSSSEPVPEPAAPPPPVVVSEEAEIPLAIPATAPPATEPVAIPVAETAPAAKPTPVAAPPPVEVAAPVAPVPVVPAPAVAEPTAVPTAADYTLVPGKNALYVVVKYERGTLGANLAHDHVIVATSYSGTVHWDPANPAACKIAVDVPTSGLRVDPPGARARAGLEGTPPVDDQPKIQENFNGPRQLDSGKFPVLTFRSTSCAPGKAENVTVNGTMTVHGVSRPTTVTMDIVADGAELSAAGRFVAKHSDFGMDPFSAAMGAVRNDQALTFVIDLDARKD